MKKIIVIVLIVGVGIGVVIGLPLYNLHFSTIDFSGDSKEIYVPSESSLSDVGDLIAAEDILAKETFIEFAEKLEFTEDKVEPGKYSIKGGMKIKELIYALKNGNQEIKDTRITFNNCKDIYDMAGQVAPSIEADSAEIADLIMDPEHIARRGFTELTIATMFFPDTYEVGEWDMTAEEFVDFMADQYKDFWSDEGIGRGSKLADLRLQQSEVSILASIIESEQGVFSQEWEIISGLYVNRIHQGIPLQSDPTAKFCWGDELEGVTRLLNVHMEKDCPYNTYIYKGLPPGPLKIPSKKAIDAVLNAEKHDYLYMCAKADNSGLHAFASTYSQHMVNARAWWKFADERGY